MIYLKLFLTFLEIGAVSFGGGYGMISLIREKVIENAWMTEDELLNLIAVAESTPGPIAVNMATFVGSEQGGFFGSLCATVAVVIPSFIIILMIVAFMGNLLKYKTVKAFLNGVRPCVVGLIVATALTMFASKVIGFTNAEQLPDVDFVAVAVFLVLAIVSCLWKKARKKAPSPILLIGISAVLGILIYPFAG